MTPTAAPTRPGPATHRDARASGRALVKAIQCFMPIVSLVVGLVIAAFAALVGALASQSAAEWLSTMPGNVRFAAYALPLALLAASVADVRAIARRLTYFPLADVLTYVYLGICYVAVAGSVLLMALYAERVATAFGAEVGLVRWVAAAAALMFLVGSMSEWRGVVGLHEWNVDAGWHAELDEIDAELDEILASAGVEDLSGVAGVRVLADRYNALAGRASAIAGADDIDCVSGTAAR